MLPRRFASLKALLTALFCFTLPLCAQTIDLQRDRISLAESHGLWRFHPGDDSRWADPNFNDSAWPLLRSDSSWSEQGYRGYSGFAWYRFTVLLPPGHDQYAIGIPRLVTSYEVFAGGRQIGSFGGMPPREQTLLCTNQVFALPPMPFGGPLLIAIRVWHWPYWAGVLGGGPAGPLRLGEIGLVQSWRAEEHRHFFWLIASGNTLMLINLLAAITGLVLFWARRTEREYLWFGIYELLTGVNHWIDNASWFYDVPWKLNYFLGVFIAGTSWLFFLLFISRILRVRRGWLFWIGAAGAGFSMLAMAAALAGGLSFNAGRIYWALGLIPYFVAILALLTRGARKGDPDARMMLLPVGLCYSTWFLLNLRGILFRAGHPGVNRYLGWMFQLSTWPFPFSLQDVTDLIMSLAVVAILPVRFARTRREQRQMAAELEGARAVQQVLIPEEIPSIPGFEVHSVFRPAGQVGGDFFQDLATRTGGALVIVGDVSG